MVWKPQAAFSGKFTKVRISMTSLTDERVKLTNQAVTGARLMKIKAWEPALEKEIRRQGSPARVVSPAVDPFVLSPLCCPVEILLCPALLVFFNLGAPDPCASR